MSACEKRRGHLGDFLGANAAKDGGDRVQLCPPIPHHLLLHVLHTVTPPTRQGKLTDYNQEKQTTVPPPSLLSDCPPSLAFHGRRWRQGERRLVGSMCRRLQPLALYPTPQPVNPDGL